jgi:four helix bundle protein
LKKLPRCEHALIAKSSRLDAEWPENRQLTLGMRHACLGCMSKPFTYRDLVVWKLGMNLAEDCYKATDAFPKSELYGLTSQLRRAAVSIPANIAEGHGRRSTKAYLNHVSIAIGSQAEFATCVELSARLGFLSQSDRLRIAGTCDTVGRLLYGLHRALKQKLAARRRNRSVS